MAEFGQTDGPEPGEDTIVIHLGHLSQAQYDAVVKSIVEFMNRRWPNVRQIGIDNWWIENKNRNQKCGRWPPCCRYWYMNEEYKNIKGILSVAFMHYLDNNRPENKMCLSNGECYDIDNAFDNQDWKKLAHYAKKYLAIADK